MKNFSSKYGSLLIAEIGGNHEGNFDYAKKLTRLAIESKVDVIKYQIYTGDTLVSKLESPIRNNHFKKFELTKAQHIYLAEMVIESGVKYSSSVWDIKALEWLDKYIDIYKIGSGDLTAYPVLEETSKKGKPMIISTGMADMKEIEAALDVILKSGTETTNVTILHCNTEYPTPMKDVNLKAMLSIKDRFKVNIGYSDHTLGIEIPIAAVALGATVIEKHFTLDKTMEGPDHKSSLDPNELKDMVVAIRNIESALGNGIKTPSESESKNKGSARKSIVANKDIKKGVVFTSENLTIKRPGNGISPMLWDEYIGKKATKDYIEDELI